MVLINIYENYRRFLNKITMYRLTLYYLIALVVIAAVVLRSVDIVLAAIIAVIVSYVANYLLAKFFRVNANVESVYITALILTLIVP